MQRCDILFRNIRHRYYEATEQECTVHLRCVGDWNGDVKYFAHTKSVDGPVASAGGWSPRDALKNLMKKVENQNWTTVLSSAITSEEDPGTFPE